MFLGRMAYRLSLLCLAISTAYPAVVAAVETANVTPEILNFVPACAQNCFQSFIAANFDASICGNSPSLQCLCRQRGSSGYTVGEGAASCLAGESRFGACQGQDGISDATSTAYNMCVGVSNAEARTHSTIVATLVLPASGTGPLLVPTTLRTVTGSVPNTGSATPTPTATVSLPRGDTSSSTTSTSSTTITTTSNTSTSSTSASATAEPAASQGQPEKLTSAQIAGIALGCAAVLVFGILLVILARCIRKRRFGDPEGGFARMRDSISFGKKSRHATSPPAGIQISSPLPRVEPARDPLDPRWHPQVPKGAVGLAISPLTARGGVFVKPSPAIGSILSVPPPPAANSTAVPAPAATSASASTSNVATALVPPTVPTFILSPPSVATPPLAGRSPPKPLLSLAIPPGQGRVAPTPANARDSVVTEFAEDGESDVAPGTAIWRPPPTDPQSATTIYFADKGGNWILRNSSIRQPEAGSSRGPPVPVKSIVVEAPAVPARVELPSPDHKTRAERAQEAFGGFSPNAMVSPLRLPNKAGNARLGSPIAFASQRRQTQFSSPSLSERMSQTAGTMQIEPVRVRNQPQDPYFAMRREPRDLTGGEAAKRRSVRKSRRISTGSVTSIESGGLDDDIDDAEPPVDLSPVAESPDTPISPGKSPVTYPKIRKRGEGQKAATTKAPEPAFPPAGSQPNAWRPAAKPPATSTSSTTSHLPSGPRRLWNAPHLRPGRNPSQVLTGSPETRPGPFPPPTISGEAYLYRQRQVGNPASYWNQPPQHPARTRQPPTPPTPPYELPTSNTPPPAAAARRYQTPPQQHPAHFPSQQQRGAGRPALPTPATTPKGQAQAQAKDTSSQTQTQGQGARDTSSQGSMLAAKRRGADKAAALVLGGGEGNAGGGQNRREGGKKKGWVKQEQEQSVPITPGWVPELTPTRRGEDFILNVR
ncbi:hypothetical protein C8A05DRAFT_16421 [Staphylotrichum tortipilum]|uniref:Extracellular membrane protein CFEM domain-containing protein n=1 Tax=Staphylotrichum tortipilum TaxID=2831512 RepID=A0AAN6MK76_9PEZI|nr:hypothetical protein C8A05DRAFT_16421 [Staphylotrichum longicolle]